MKRPEGDEMQEQERILQTIYSAVDELNTQLPKGVRVEKRPDAPLYGKEGKLESIDLVGFIIEVEEKINEEFGASITIADERAMSEQNSPFRTLGTLSEYVSGLLEENGVNGNN
jgi:acyl carrier protein